MNAKIACLMACSLVAIGLPSMVSAQAQGGAAAPAALPVASRRKARLIAGAGGPGSAAAAVRGVAWGGPTLQAAPTARAMPRAPAGPSAEARDSLGCASPARPPGPPRERHCNRSPSALGS